MAVQLGSNPARIVSETTYVGVIPVVNEAVLLDVVALDGKNRATFRLRLNPRGAYSHGRLGITHGNTYEESDIADYGVLKTLLVDLGAVRLTLPFTLEDHLEDLMSFVLDFFALGQRIA